MQELSKELGTLITKAIQFQEKMSPSTTNKLFQRWRNLNPNENINEYINLGIEITKLQNVYDRDITSFYETLNKFISSNVKQMNNLTCFNYLCLARTSFENNYKLLNQIYDQIDVQEEMDFNFLKYSADLQCDNLKYISKLIDVIHPEVNETQFNQYLYSLFVLFPNEQSDLLLKLISDKKFRHFTPGNYLLMHHLCESRNITPPKKFQIVDQNVKFRIVEQSHLQQEIEILLNMINLPFEQEKMIDDMYQVDFYLPQDNQILEVNGPYHYVYDMEIDNNPRIFTGKHYYKQMCLSALGYDVRNMCYLDYYDSKGTSGRLKLLKSVLE